jgi:outer membrane protein insertion porin family
MPSIQAAVAWAVASSLGVPMRIAALTVLVLLLTAGHLVAQENPRVIRQVKFEGNQAITDEVLASAISTTQSSWFARSFFFRWLGLGEKRYFDEQEFRRDVVRIGVLYRRSGFPRVQVDTAVRRTPQNAFITFRIKEGDPIRVTSFGVTGLDSLPQRIRQLTVVDLPLQQGDPFNRYEMQATADTITRRLRDRGYPTARVYSSFETNLQTETASVTLEVVPGTHAVIGNVEVVGAKRVEPDLVRNLLVSRPGRRYSQDELFQSQRNLYQSDLFRFATVNIDSAQFQPNADSVPLLVQVNESKRRRIRSAIGYGTEDCFRGSAGWTSRNFLGGGGRILDLTSRVSKVGVGDPVDWGLRNTICGASKHDTIGSAKANFSLGASIRRPAFLSPNNTISVAVFTERRSEFNVYLRRETGTTITLRRETPRRRLPLSLAYTLSYGHTEATPVSFCASFNACTDDVIDLLRQNRVLATLTANASIPRTNNPIDPSRGSIKSLEVTVSSRLLGSASFEQFTRFVAEAAWYRPLARDVVLSWRMRGGLIFAPRVDVATQSGNFIPPEQRFYAGGPNDVRGFDRNELGPVVYVVSQAHLDSVGGLAKAERDSIQVAATGGNSLAVGNLELRVPSPIFSSRMRLAAFVDAGGVWQRGSGGTGAVIRVTPGVGFRINTPLGPARLDVAYNPYKLQAGTLFQFDSAGTLTVLQESFVRARGSKFNFHIAVGQPF